MGSSHSPSSPTGYTVIGGGKTAMDACLWLLDSGVPPDAIRWIRPRDAWILDRMATEPLDRLPGLIEKVSRELEAAAEAESVDDLFQRLEAGGNLIRLDPTVEPTMYRCATVSTAELEQLRRIENVVRQGRVTSIEPERVVMEAGSIPTDAGQVHVDCSAGGLTLSPGRTVFEPDRITLQQVRTCQPTFNAAFIAFVEATGADDAAKNHLCPPNQYPNTAPDWLEVTRRSQIAGSRWMADPEVQAWMERSRLNAARGIADHLEDPQMQSALARFMTNAEPSVTNLDKLIAQSA